MRKRPLPFLKLQNIVLILTLTCLFIQMLLLVWYVKIRYVNQNRIISNYKFTGEQYFSEKNHQVHKVVKNIFRQTIFSDIFDTEDETTDNGQVNLVEVAQDSLYQDLQEYGFETSTEIVVPLDELYQDISENGFGQNTEIVVPWDELYQNISENGFETSTEIVVPWDELYQDFQENGFETSTEKVVPLDELYQDIQENQFETSTEKIEPLDKLYQDIQENVIEANTDEIMPLDEMHPNAADKKTTTFTKKPKDLSSKIKKLKDIKRSTSNIFFIESKCGTHKLIEEKLKKQHEGEFVLSVRQSCSVESASSANPSRNIYVLHTCLLTGRTPKYARQLLRLNNVWLVHLNVTEFYQGTPVQTLYQSGRIEQSRYPIEHSSDILRLTVLWKYGGTYMDLDVITLRPLGDLNTNFCGLESNKAMGNAILNFEPQGYGHDLLTTILNHLNDNFDGRYWAVNGPQLITHIILNECNATIETVKNCTIFKVFDQSVLYPIPWMQYKTIFSDTPGSGAEIVERVKKTGYFIHMWNNYTHVYDVHVGSGQAYALLAHQFCPLLYNTVKVFK